MVLEVDDGETVYQGVEKGSPLGSAICNYVPISFFTLSTIWLVESGPLAT